MLPGTMSLFFFYSSLFCFSAFFVVGVNFSDAQLVDYAADRHLRAAHEAYLRGDFYSLLKGVKAVFEAGDTNLAMQKNSLELVDKAQQVLGNEPFEVDWSFPLGLLAVEIRFRTRICADNRHHFVEFSGLSFSPSPMKGFRIRTFTGEEVFRVSGEEQEKRSSQPVYYPGGEGERFSYRHRLSDSPREGLYYLDCFFESGLSEQIWFFLSGGRQELEQDLNNEIIEDYQRGASEKASLFTMKLNVNGENSNRVLLAGFMKDTESLSVSREKELGDFYKEAMKKNILAAEEKTQIGHKNDDKKVYQRVIQLRQHNRLLFGRLSVVREWLTEVPFD
jgi:hypothetical protein